MKAFLALGKLEPKADGSCVLQHKLCPDAHMTLYCVSMAVIIGCHVSVAYWIELHVLLHLGFGHSGCDLMCSILATLGILTA